MAGFTLGSRETALIGDIVEAAREPCAQPLPWTVLEKLRALLSAESLAFQCLDSGVPRVVFAQFIEPWGEHGMESETAAEAEVNPFWQRYWGPSGCSYPDLSGDYRYVRRASDHATARQRRELLAAQEVTESCWQRYLEACLPGRSPGRYFRVGAYRGGRDFSEREVFCLTLLQPHLEQAFWAGAGARRATPRLTPRQLEILRMVRAGLTNRQIARRTHLSEGTVRVHLANVFERLGVHSRGAAVHRVFDSAEDWSEPVRPGDG